MSYGSWWVRKKVTGVDLKILKELEEPRGGRPWLSRHEKNRADLQRDYSISVLFVNMLLISVLFVRGWAVSVFARAGICGRISIRQNGKNQRTRSQNGKGST
jgi:hypothetical protein